MGKKKDKKQKGKGAEKTAMKTERKADKKTKKMLKEKGEEDIEALIAEFQHKDRQRTETVEEKCSPPSRRCNMTLTAHPDKDELIMFGGEYFNGAKTFMYNDMYFYNTRSGEWSLLKVPISPPPRCAHQMVAMRQAGGQLWMFGGEFASPTQSQFYHYKDLWIFNLRDKAWAKISASGGPTARSGHRMVAFKKQILVFGGFHDNIRDYKYFNDLYAFDTETYTWTQIQPTGSLPHPRSACVMTCTQDQSRVLVYGGYSKEKVKRDVDKGKIHTDMFALSPEVKSKEEGAPVKWKWAPVKQSGVRPSPRCGCSLVPTPGNRALLFGGVFDEEEDEEELSGKFYNDMYSLELDNGKWHEVFLRGKKDSKEKKKRRRKKAKETDDDDGEADEEEASDTSDLEEDMEQEVEGLKVTEDAERSSQTTTTTDGVFTVTVGGGGSSSAASHSGVNVTESSVSDTRFWPRPRMNTLLAMKNGILYLYGGLFEEGDKQMTLCDFYTLDLHKLEDWETLIPDEEKNMKAEWQESDSSSSSGDDSADEEELGGAKGGDSESEEDMELGEAPTPKKSETTSDYFSRTKDYWMLKADEIATQEGMDVNTKQLKKAALKLADEFITTGQPQT